MKKNWKLKLSLIILGIIILLAVLLIVKKEYFDKVDSVISIYDEKDEKTSIYVDGKLIGKVLGKAKLNNNMDNSAVFVETENDVYLLEDKKLTEIAKNMKLKVFANNSNEALLEDKEGALYLYSDYGVTMITEDEVSVVAISGDGKVYSYSTNETAFFGSRPGKEKSVDGVVISHISEDGKYMYATKHTTAEQFTLSVVNQRGEISLIEEKATSIVGLNASGTEIMYTSGKGTFVSVEGSEPKLVTEKLVLDVYYYDDEKFWCGDFWSIDTLKNSICEVMEANGTTSPTSLCKISKDYIAETIVSDCYEFIGINDSMNRIFYKGKNSNLYRIEAKLDAKGELLAENVDLARISPDGKDVYFTRIGSEDITILYHSENGLKEKELAYVFDFFDIIVYNDYCYIEAEEIHYVKNDKVEKLEDMDDIQGFFIDYLTQTAYGYDKNNVYKFDGKKKITLEGEYKSIASYDYVY